MQAPDQVQRGSGEGSKASGEGLGGVGAEAGQVKQGSEKVPEKVPKKVWEALVQSQVRFNRVPVPEKVPGEGLGWEALVQPGQVQQGSGEGSSAWLCSTLQKDL